MIENDEQLRYSVQSVAKMYDLCDRIAAQTIGDPDTRTDEIESAASMIRRIEREIGEYLAKKYSIEMTPTKKAA